jgi:hypothetical protein
LLGLLQLAPSDKVEMYKDELEEATTQIISLKKQLAEHRESQYLRSVMMDRNTLTPSPIHKKRHQAQASVSESRVEPSSNTSDNVPLQKPSSDIIKLVQKKIDFCAVHQVSQAVTPVKTSSIPHTQVRNIQLKHNIYIASKIYIYFISVNPFRS